MVENYKENINNVNNKYPNWARKIIWQRLML